MAADYGVTTAGQMSGLYRKVQGGKMSVLQRAKAKLGSGKRFSALRDKLDQRQGVHDPDALAAYIGRKKFGKARFQALGRK